MRIRYKDLPWLLILFVSVPVMASAITVLEPNGVGIEEVAEGVEFGAYDKGNRWDMSDPADVVSTESGYLGDESISGGIYSAVTLEDASPDGFTDAKFFLTWPGLPGAVNSMESGQRAVVDTSIYRKFTLRIRIRGLDNQPTGGNHPVQVFFLQDEYSISQGVLGFTNGKHIPGDGEWHVVEFDMIDDLSPSSNYEWTDFATVKGLRIDPTNRADVRVEVDWVRLTSAADVNSRFSVRWSGGTPPYTISAKQSGVVIMELATDIDTTSADVDFSKLPGGDYIIEVSDRDGQADSGASLKINEAPLFAFLQPDLSGDISRRYSLIEAGNPWGPIDAGDIGNTALLTNISYSNPTGTLTATSTGSDSRIFFNVPTSIDTNHYRMLSYTMSVSGERDIGRGSVTRVFWGNNLSALQTSQDVVVQEGLNTYLIGDMKDLPMDGGGPNQWLGNPLYFRIDPHEFPEQRNIRFDNVSLSPPDTADPTFDITWMDFDTDDDASIELYADTDKIPGNGNETLITSGIAEDHAADMFTWNASQDVVDGEYYLYARISDNLSQTIRYADGPLVVGSGSTIELTVTEPNGTNDAVQAADEFSRVVEGNPWDMSGDDDVPLSRASGFSSLVVANGVLSGTTTNNDPLFYLMFPGATNGHDGSDGSLKPIDTSRYRYLTFKARYDGLGPHYFQVLFTWDKTFAPGTVGFTDGLKVFPGEWNIITIDLHARSSVNSPFAWQDVPQVQGLRIDPTTVSGTGIEFDWFTLTAEANGSAEYVVRWSATDPGDSTLDIRAVDSMGFKIPMLTGVAPQLGQASIDVTRLPLGDFQIEVDAVPGGLALSPGSFSITDQIPGTDNELRNIATRADVGTIAANELAIAGFIISGDAKKCVVIRGRGPSVNVPEGEVRLPDPLLELKLGSTTLAKNDNWQIQEQPVDALIIQDLGQAPPDIMESAIYECLNPGGYTALLSGYQNTTGIGLVEVFDADENTPYLRNIATRARIGTGNLVSIAGFVITGTKPRTVLINGRGPSVGVPQGVARLANPKLDLKLGQTTLKVNDNWQDADNVQDIINSGHAPTDPLDAAILVELEPGAYTAILSGVGGGTGTGIVEVFDLSGR